MNKPSKRLRATLIRETIFYEKEDFNKTTLLLAMKQGDGPEPEIPQTFTRLMLFCAPHNAYPCVTHTTDTYTVTHVLCCVLIGLNQ